MSKKFTITKKQLRKMIKAADRILSNFHKISVGSGPHKGIKDKKRKNTLQAQEFTDD